MSTLSAAQVAAFELDGYLVLEGAIESEAVERLRSEADVAVCWQDERIAAGDFVDSINHPGKHYFVPRRSRERPVVREHTRIPMMLDICRRLIGPDVWLFTELFICKMPGCDIDFGWHQDTGYIHSFGFSQYPPNISVWTALDPMTRHNGALSVRPYSRGGPTRVQPHAPDAHGHQVIDMPDGEDVLLEVPAGSIIVFAGTLAHRSGPNRSEGPRRAHLVQYGAQPFLVDGEPIQLADPILAGGRIAGQAPAGDESP